MNPHLDERLSSIVHGAARLLLGHRWKLWFWADSIGLEGLQDASALTGDGTYAGYVYGLLKGWIPRMAHRSKFDYTAAGVSLVRAYEQTRDPALLEAAVEHARYMASFRRTDGGAYMRYEDAAIELPPELPPDHPDYHLNPEKARKVTDGGPCVFVDNMHFDGPFFARLYHVTGDEQYRRLAVENLLGSIELLLDRPTGLFYHFWIERERRPNGVLWGRGNGWAMLGLLHTLAYLPKDDPAYGQILEVFRRQTQALAELQDTSGDWHTVLNDKDSYLETSIAAFVVDGWSFAIRQGWIGAEYRPVIERAWKAMLSHVEPNGKLAGVSYETFPSTRPEHYRTMPRDAVVPWGQGPLLTAIHSYLQG